MPELSSPRGPIPYTRDPWGYPDIEVRDAQEAAWARGWFHGHDRQGQVRLLLMAAQGRMMEVLGDVPLARYVDRSLRGLGFSRDLEAQVAALDEATRELFEVYCAGFDAGVAAAGRPWILRLLRLPRQPYRVHDILLVYRILSWFGLGSLTQMARQAVGQLQARGIGGDELAFLLGPHGAEGLDASAAEGLSWPESLVMAPLAAPGGSNAFAVGPSRSKSGGALLMAEFHMEIGRQPPVLYAASTRSRDGRVYQGVGIPGWPFVSAGRTRSVGWSYTFGHANQFVLTAERCRDGARHTPEGMRPLTRRVEEVRIRGRREPERWTYWDDGELTVHGDPTREGVLPAMQWRGLHHSGADLTRFAGQTHMTRAEEMAKSHVQIVAISCALVAVDSEGHVAWAHSGSVEERPAGWGVQAGGRTASPPAAPPPMVVDPEEGFVASANEASPGFTAFPEPPYRHQRLRQTLASRSDWTARGLLEASYDATDLCAERLLGIWKPLLPDQPEVRAMVEWSERQSRQLDTADRVHARRFHALHRAVTRAVLAGRLGEPVAAFLIDDVDVYLQLQAHIDDVLALEHPDWLDQAALRQLLAQAWPTAVAHEAAGDVAGPVSARFKNVLTQGKLPAWMGLSTAPVELPGTPTSPFQVRQVNVFGERLVAGPSFHLMLDMSTEGGWYNLAGGASERWRGVGYGTAIAEWASGVVAPLPGED